MARMGRPKKAAGEKRGVRVYMAMTEEEVRMLDAAAALDAVEARADWAYRAVMKAVEERLRRAVAQDD